MTTDDFAPLFSAFVAGYLVVLFRERTALRRKRTSALGTTPSIRAAGCVVPDLTYSTDIKPNL